MLESQIPPADSPVVSDPGIPTLEAVTDPATMAKHLRQAFADDRGPIQDIQFDVLKHHPGSRCTLEIAWLSARGPTCVIGKVYAVDRYDLYRTMSELRRGGFGPEHEISIPLPLAYLPELRLLLQEKVVGPRVKDVFLTGDAHDQAEAAERCGRWLAHFHASAPRLGRVSRLSEHLRFLEDWSRSLPELGGPLAGKATRLFRLLDSAARGAGESAHCAGHGHYGCGHIVLARGPTVEVPSATANGLIGSLSVSTDRTVAIDWDTVDVADPLRDVARFLVELKRLGLKYFGSIDTFDAAADHFLKTYLSRFGGVNGENLPLFVATRCLRSARKDIRRGAGGWSERAQAMLDEGIRVLERGL